MKDEKECFVKGLDSRTVLVGQHVKKKVLLCIPNSYIAEICAREIKKSGYDVVVCTSCRDIMFIYENEIQKCLPNKGVNPFFTVIIDEGIFGADFVMNKILGINQYQKFIVVMNDVPVFPSKYKNIEILAKPFSARMLLEKLASI